MSRIACEHFSYDKTTSQTRRSHVRGKWNNCSTELSKVTSNSVNTAFFWGGGARPHFLPWKIFLATPLIADRPKRIKRRQTIYEYETSKAAVLTTMLHVDILIVTRWRADNTTDSLMMHCDAAPLLQSSAVNFKATVTRCTALWYLLQAISIRLSGWDLQS